MTGFKAEWWFDSGYFTDVFDTKPEAESMIRRVENMGAFKTKITEVS